jgi:DEK C terminal domain
LTEVPSEVRAQYVAIIDSILVDADLTTVSVKQVRNGIQAKVQYDITPHKVGEILHATKMAADCRMTRPRSTISFAKDSM